MKANCDGQWTPLDCEIPFPYSTEERIKCFPYAIKSYTINKTDKI